MQLPFITVTSQQARLLRLGVLSLGSVGILYLLFTVSTSVSGPSLHAPSWSDDRSSSPKLGGWGGLGGADDEVDVSSSQDELLVSGSFGTVQYDEFGRFRYSESHPWLSSGGRERRRILAGSTFGAHEDVYMSLVNSLKTYTNSIRIYTPGFRWGFADVVKDLDVYDGRYYDAVQIVGDAGKSNLWQGEDLGKKADVVILGTCEVDMEPLSAGLWKQWQARDEDDKFILVCVVHNAFATGWLRDFAKDWVKAGALRIAPISAHVKRAFIYNLDTFADTPGLHKIGYDTIPIHVHVPLLPLKLPERTQPQKSMLTNAVVQGNFDPNRRDYAGIYKDLLAELKLDPRPWGYHQVGNEPEYIPNPTLDITPFVLHLAGNGDMVVPKELTNVVRIHKNLPYNDFFETMHSMDIAFTAFTSASKEETKGGYYEVQASSSVAMAMMCQVPLLTTHHIEKVYTYTSSPLVSIHRPSYFREIEVVKILRAGKWVRTEEEEETDAVVPPGVEEETERMLAMGWKRSDEGWKEWRDKIDRQNVEVARAILMGW